MWYMYTFLILYGFCGTVMFGIAAISATRQSLPADFLDFVGAAALVYTLWPVLVLDAYADWRQLR